MNKYILLFLFVCFSLFAQAQVETKYSFGAVPEVDGKVAFSRTINVENGISSENLFGLMEKWVENNYNKNDGSKNRVLLINPEKGNIACLGEKVLVFKRSALSLDQAIMTYQLILNVEQDKCVATVRSIKYDYASDKNLSSAEEMITDKVALKSDGKMHRSYDKFRIFTIDSISSIFNSIDVYLNGLRTKGAAQQNSVVGQSDQPIPDTGAMLKNEIQNIAPIASSAKMDGYKNISADKIPGNIIKLLNDWILITSGTDDKINVMTASWGGLGVLWEKPVSFCFINPTRYSINTMDEGDTYTISFYTEAYKDAMLYCGTKSGRDTDKIKGSGLTPIKTPSGATVFSEAWMILECKKIIAQPIQSESVIVKPSNNDWSKNGYHKMYIGEILNVWVK